MIGALPNGFLIWLLISSDKDIFIEEMKVTEVEWEWLVAPLILSVGKHTWDVGIKL